MIFLPKKLPKILPKALPKTLSGTAFIIALATASQYANAQTVTVSAPWEIKAQNPVLGGFAFTRMGVAETLIGIDKAGKLKPQLATDWSVSNDKMAWTLTLRDDVSFTDGEKLTAEGVVTALQFANNHPGPLKKAPVKNIEAKDGKVVIALEKPFSILPAVLSNYTTMILSPKVYDGTDKVKAIVGTGPYVISKFSPPQSMSMVKNDNYWGEKAHIEKTEYLAASRGETRALMAESKPEIMAYNIDPASLTRLERNPNLTVMNVMLPRVVVLKINNKHEWLKDLNVRKALSFSLDRNGIATALIRKPQLKTDQLLPPSVAEWHNDALTPLTYDVDAAKASLKKAGFTVNKDGYAEKDGKVLELTLRTFSDRPELPLIANAMQDMFKKIGVKLNISIGNYTEISAGHQDGTLELALFSRNYATVQSPLNNIAGDFGRHGDKWGGDWGAMNWENDAVAQALEALKLDNTGAEADKNRAIVTQAIQEELPIIPVTWYEQSVVVSKNLENVTIDPFGMNYRINEVKVKQ